MYYEKETADKPEKWPANAREQILDTLCEISSLKTYIYNIIAEFLKFFVYRCHLQGGIGIR